MKNLSKWQSMRGIGEQTMDKYFTVCLIAVFLGGVATPIVLNILADTWGWFK
jgi:hypothetical protein